jgi:hypothetical protein
MEMENTTITLKHSIVTLIVIAVLANLLPACSAKEAPVTVPPGAQAGDLAVEPCTYEARDVEYAADCGTLVVPENRADPGSRLLALPVIRVRALGNDPTEPIFRLGGGPGQSNMGFRRLERLIENHDVVLVGYRGVASAPELQCPEFIQAAKGLGDNLLSEASIVSMGDALTRCAARLQTEGADWMAIPSSSRLKTWKQPAPGWATHASTRIPPSADLGCGDTAGEWECRRHDASALCYGEAPASSGQWPASHLV